MTTQLLNINQSPDELAKVHSDDYYWYLRSEPFIRAFIWPLGDAVNRIGKPCLDVGCGEGYLHDFVHVPYFGFDGSATAIQKAIEARGDHFTVGRMESPHVPAGFVPGVVVFAGIFHVLVKKGRRTELVELYRERFPSLSHMVICDLELLDQGEFDSRYRLLSSLHATADCPGVIEVKRRRKILIYELAEPTQ